MIEKRKIFCVLIFDKYIFQKINLVDDQSKTKIKTHDGSEYLMLVS
jgi:hypothetical protein